MPCFAYPPLTIFPHLWIIGCLVWRHLCCARGSKKCKEHRSVITTVFSKTRIENGEDSIESTSVISLLQKWCRKIPQYLIESGIDSRMPLPRVSLDQPFGWIRTKRLNHPQTYQRRSFIFLPLSALLFALLCRKNDENSHENIQMQISEVRTSSARVISKKILI